jgi:signal peptidase I
MALSEKFSSVKKKFRFLDPFTYVDAWVIPRVHNAPKKVQYVLSFFSLIFVAIAVYFIVLAQAMPLYQYALVMLVFFAVFYFFMKEDAIDWSIYMLFAFVFAFIALSILGILLGTRFPMVIVISQSMSPLINRGDVVILQSAETGVACQEVSLDLPTLKELPLRYYAVPYCTSLNPLLETESRPCEEFKTALVQGQISASDFTTTKIVFQNNEELILNEEGDIVVYYSDVKNEPIIHRAIAKITVGDGTYLLTKGDSSLNPLIDQQAGITNYALNVSEIEGKTVFWIPIVGYGKLLIFDTIPNLVFGCPKGQTCYFP